jgi:hypothetical protein
MPSSDLPQTLQVIHQSGCEDAPSGNQVCQVFCSKHKPLTVFLSVWLFMWTIQKDMLWTVFPHSSHTNKFSPICNDKCFTSPPFTWNAFLHNLTLMFLHRLEPMVLWSFIEKWLHCPICSATSHTEMATHHACVHNWISIDTPWLHMPQLKLYCPKCPCSWTFIYILSSVHSRAHHTYQDSNPWSHRILFVIICWG